MNDAEIAMRKHFAKVWDNRAKGLTTTNTYMAGYADGQRAMLEKVKGMAVCDWSTHLCSLRLNFDELAKEIDHE